MTEAFLKAYETVLLPNEGGYVFDPLDRGGETYKGIARKFWPKWEGWQSIDKIKGQASSARAINAAAATDNELQDLVKKFYYENFAKPIRFDEITDNSLRTKVLDVAVNVGVRVASRWLQEAVNTLSNRSVLVIDGKIGNMTVKEVNIRSARALIALFRASQTDHYLSIVKRNPTQLRFLIGWLNRAAL